MSNFHGFYDEEDAQLSNAALWCVRLDRGLTDDESKQLQEEIQLDSGLLKELSEYKFLNLQLSKFYEEASSVVTITTSPVKRFSFPAYRLAFSLAASIVLGIACLFYIISERANSAGLLISSFEMATTRVLEDGSLVRINSGSSIRISYSSKERRVELLEGEAIFTVIKDPERPFLVYADDIVVKAVGTEFNVRKNGAIHVLVTEGTVAVSHNDEGHFELEFPTSANGREEYHQSLKYEARNAILVDAGCMAKIAKRPEEIAYSVEIENTPIEDLKRELWWRQSLLTIEGQNLKAIAKEFQQKTGYELRINDKALEALQIGGNYPSNNAVGFMNALHSFYGINWTQEDNVFVITGRNQPGIN